MRTFEESIVHLRKSPITGLPPELLSIIFKFAHKNRTPIQPKRDIIPTWMRMDGPEGFKQSVMALVHPTIPQDPKSPTLFPYSLAAVCSLWRDILYAYPKFWTLVVLFIDSKPTSLVEASLLLKRSRERRIDVFITRRDQLLPTLHPDLHERCQIDAFLRILKPHLHRCRSLHLDAHLSSSFPIIYKSFHRIQAPYLKSMEFVCDAHAFPEDDDDDLDDDDNLDSYDNLDNDYDLANDAGFEFDPDLTHLIINGNYFHQNSKYPSTWMHRLEQITIAHYDGYYVLEDVVEFLTSLPLLDQLKFDSLQSSLLFYDDDHRPVIAIPHIHLQDVSDRFIADFFDCVDFALLSTLRITRCRSLPNQISNFGGKPETLVLEDISSEINLLGVITNWLGENLWLDRCHSFSGMDLKALGSRTAGLYPCNGMDCLLLYRLPPFSISLLKKMIEERNSEVRYDDPNWKTTTEFGPAISHLAVVHCGTGELSVEDEIWFRSRLVEFYWGSCPPSLNPSH